MKVKTEFIEGEVQMEVIAKRFRKLKRHVAVVIADPNTLIDYVLLL